jgi:hypothetical protein
MVWPANQFLATAIAQRSAVTKEHGRGRFNSSKEVTIAEGINPLAQGIPIRTF